MHFLLALFATIVSLSSGALGQSALGPPIDCSVFTGADATQCKIANGGNLDAIVRTGLLLSQGPDRLRNETEAVRLFRFAADRGDAGGQAQLAFQLAAGRGVERNEPEAVKYYRLASQQCDLYATAELGAKFLHGFGVERNVQEGVRLLGIAADKGHAVAQIQLAYAYESGDGIARDDVEAVRLYTMSAKQNYTWALLSIAYMNANGRGVVRNRDEALRLAREVARQKPGEVAYLAAAAKLLARFDLQPAEAREWAERAYALNPKDSDAARALALVLSQQGQATRAAQILDDALSLFPARCWECFEEAGDVFAAVGRNEDARRQWARALASWPLQRYSRYSSREGLEAKLAR